MTEGENKKLKSLIRFHSANKIDSYNRGGKKEKKKRKKSKESTEKSKHKNNKCFSESLLSESFPSLGVTVHLTSPRMPSNTALISDLLWGQLIWSFSCVFLPPMSTATRTSVFSFVEALNDLLYIRKTQCA